MNAWMLFYKGTALSFPYEQQARLIALWESTIIAGLRSGVSIEQQKMQCKEDLDELEKWICVIMAGEQEGYTNADIEKKIGKKDYSLLLNKWGLNVVCGLKLKVIVNDDKNGHLLMYEKIPGVTITPSQSAELTPRQIARIERIRAKRADAKKQFAILLDMAKNQKIPLPLLYNDPIV